jgi:hypothetical protein
VGGFYSSILGYTLSGGVSPSPLFLTTGAYTVSASGGADVGAFSVNLAGAPTITWTSSDGSSVVNRSSGLTVNWTVTGGNTANLEAIISGGNSDGPDNRSEVFLCTASAAAGTFTVPGVILSRVPASRSGGQSLGLVGVGMLPTQPQATFHATGLDYGLADSLAASVHFVTFQ